jgi:hypothetical protein
LADRLSDARVGGDPIGALLLDEVGRVKVENVKVISAAVGAALMRPLR